MKLFLSILISIILSILLGLATVTAIAQMSNCNSGVGNVGCMGIAFLGFAILLNISPILTLILIPVIYFIFFKAQTNTTSGRIVLFTTATISAILTVFILQKYLGSVSLVSIPILICILLAGNTTILFYKFIKALNIKG